MDTSLYRKLVVAVNTKVPLINGEYGQAINFDNAATTPPFKTVINDIMKFMYLYSSVHRGFGYKSQFSTKAYENSRDVVAKFVKCSSQSNSIIFVKNTTEAINKLANTLYPKLKNSVILSTDMEHHSNDLPWRKYNIDYISVDENYRLSLDDLKMKLQKYNGRVKLVTVTGASNVTGYKNSIHKIAKIVHSYGAKLLVDGAQLVPHAVVDMKPMNSDEHIDYLAFSAHKMYAPFGSGVLIAPKTDLNDIAPDYSGGGTVDIVTHDSIKWLDTPNKDEAGSPNVFGVVALASSLKTLSMIEMHNIEIYENYLCKYAIDALKNISGLKIYCDTNPCYNHIATIPFNVIGINHATVAKILSYEFGISVRDGCFCAQPYVQKVLGLSKKEINEKILTNNHKPGMVRISLGLYNTTKEIDVLIYALTKIISKKEEYIKKYSSLPNDLYFPI